LGAALSDEPAAFGRGLGVRLAVGGVAGAVGAEGDRADHLVPGALGAVLGLPLVVVEAAIDLDVAALGEVLGDRAGALAELSDVDEGGLAVAAVVDGDADLDDVLAVAQLTELGVAGQSAGEQHAVHLGPPLCGWW